MKLILLASLLATNNSFASDIVLSSNIKSNLEKKIENDLRVLENFKFTKETEVSTLKLMEMDELSAANATDWLESRVKYIIEEKALSVFKLLIKKVIFVEKEGVTFPNQDILPYSIDPKNALVNEDGDEGVTVMSNIGAGLYMAGKKENKVYGMKISRGLLKKPIKALVESPRVGIIQIGEGLFDPRLTVNNQNEDALANSINRLGTFFHEARHSDGNGSSLSFAHSPCPAGHDMEGLYACDESLNGPYAVGATMTREMLKSCAENCSEKDKEIIKIIILDSENRILKTNRRNLPAVSWDASPESL